MTSRRSSAISPSATAGSATSSSTWRGGEGEETDPPKEGEIVYADEEKILCRRWNWRQDMRSLVTPLTRRAVVTVQANGAGDLDAAVADLRDLLGRFAAARTSVTIADRHRPLARVG